MATITLRMRTISMRIMLTWGSAMKSTTLTTWSGLTKTTMTGSLRNIQIDYCYSSLKSEYH